MDAGVRRRLLPDDQVEAPILMVLAESTAPLGARQVQQALEVRGTMMSESTIARRLRDLDAEGVTHRTSSRGRVLTQGGRQRVAAHLRAKRGSLGLVAASRIETAQDVLNLLRARRAVEPEAVREAADHLSTDEASRLETLIEEHRQIFSATPHDPRDLALGFHRTVTGLSKNPLMKAMLAIVLDPSLDRIEATLDVILDAHQTDKESISEHQAILEALVAAEAENAAELMHNHLNRLIHEVERFIAEHDGGLLERLIAWR